MTASTPWRSCVLTLFPGLYPGPLGASLSGRALAEGKWRLEARDIRTYATDKHRSVDDTPAGGGAGMVMRPDVAAAAIDAARIDFPDCPVIYPTPRGVPLTQKRVHALKEGPGAIIFCGRFEGLDQRVIEARGMEEISIGDYVLSGGDLPAMVLIEACVRLLPDVLGSERSLAEESFEMGLLEYPQYTKPRVWEGRAIPEELVSGDHGLIERWRKERAEADTRARRPDLWASYEKRRGG